MFKVQVKMKEWNAGKMIYVWKDVRPSNSSLPYLWESKGGAMLARDRMNDGGRTLDDFRIIEIGRQGDPDMEV